MKNRIVFLISILVVGLLGVWLGYYLSQNCNNCGNKQYSQTEKMRPIPLERAQELHDNYLKFSGCNFSREATKTMQFPLVIDDAKQGLSDIFAQPGYKDLLMFPGIKLDAKGKPVFTVIFIGRNNDSTLITAQTRQPSETSREITFKPSIAPDVIQDDNRPCRPCNNL